MVQEQGWEWVAQTWWEMGTNDTRAEVKESAVYREEGDTPMRFKDPSADVCSASCGSDPMVRYFDLSNRKNELNKCRITVNENDSSHQGQL